ncbi:MAG: HlyD family efflux transporter periplasmic adaptor subunit [Bacteroidia bacterium]|nr:HlyD family efflux transporter periplasmic adaptor subunit [Bacteroidia bacterium]
MKVLILLTAVFLASAALTSCGNGGDLSTPDVKPIVEAVYASGFVVSHGEYEITAQAEGYLVEKLVDDGDRVKKGDPLFVIDADQTTARFRIAQEKYTMARKNAGDNSPVLQELKAATETARTKMAFDSANFVRYTNLLKGNATSQAEYDRMKLAYENSRNEYQLQKSRYDKNRDALELELQNARNQLAISRDEQGMHTLRSQVDGMIFKTTKEQGELVRRYEVLAIAGQRDSYYIELNVDELDVQRVKPGQDVLVTIDAYPKNLFHGTVTKIYPMIDKRQQSVKVNVDLKEQLPGWYSGLSLEANIIVRQKEKAIVVPKTALVGPDSIMIVRDGERKRTRVETGIENLDEVEIVGGLDSLTQIVVKH